MPKGKSLPGRVQDNPELVAREALLRQKSLVRLLVAVSGGADSCALLATCAALRAEFGFSLFTLHVDHGLRSPAEASADLSVVRNLCRALKVPLLVTRVPRGRIVAGAATRGRGIEDEARRVRRRAYARGLAHFHADRVLLAHTMDDVLEGTLLRILRGAGPLGLSSLAESKGAILRPLLACSRQGLRSYLLERGIRWSEDASNADPAFLRNRIRLELVPLLDDRFPSWRGALRTLRLRQGTMADYLGQSSREILTHARSDGYGRIVLDKSSWKESPQAVREETLLIAANRALRDARRALLGSPFPRADRMPQRREIPYRTLHGLCSLDNPRGDLGAFAVFPRSEGLEVSAQGFSRPERGFFIEIHSPGSYRLPFATLVVGLGDGIVPLTVFPILARSACPKEVAKVRSRGDVRAAVSAASLPAAHSLGDSLVIIEQSGAPTQFLVCGISRPFAIDSASRDCSPGLTFSIL